MGLTFNSLLDDYGIDPRDVRLLRHQTIKYAGRTPYTLWRDDHDGFLLYQSIQSVQNGPKLTGRYWASFVVTPAASTLFVGLYEIEKIGPCDPTIIDPLRGVPVTQGGARELDLYRQAVVGVSMEDAGRVYIDWGPGTRAWVQSAQEKPKPILEVTRIFQEEAFPGYTAFIANLSAIEALPSN